MKCYLLPSSAVLALGLAACNTGTGPLSSDFDPMRPPGSSIGMTKPKSTTFTEGQFVAAILDQTAFYNNRPSGGAEADQLLPRGTSMKVISESDSYLKVELDSGKVGFVPIVMVEDASARAAGTVPNPNEVQIYPPVPAADGTLPTTPGVEQPPGGAIPTVIPTDPSALPGTPTPLPPTAPGNSPAPLPPNGDELKAMREKSPSQGQ
jgi:hypothetical protein